MKKQMTRPVGGRVPIPPQVSVQELTLEGEPLERKLRHCLTAFSQGILDPDIAGKSPDRFLENLQSGRLGEFARRVITLASVGGQECGVLIALPGPGDWYHIYALHVSPEHRRKGVGWALLAQIQNQLAPQGVGELRLDVHGDNAPALALYQKFGFTERP